MEKVLILGGRRGLGAAVAKKWADQFPEGELTLTSRKEFSSPHSTLVADFNKDEDIEKLAGFMRTWQPTRIFCFVGGGPHGLFQEKALKDHLWAVKIGFLAPLQLLHAHFQLPHPCQWILTGSAIAEERPDARAASYAASKHALRGLIGSIKAENPALDVRLFSPGYMNTDMLPANSAPRLENRVLDPAKVAEDFMKWALDPQAAWHRVCRS